VQHDPSDWVGVMVGDPAYLEIDGVVGGRERRGRQLFRHCKFPDHVLGSSCLGVSIVWWKISHAFLQIGIVDRGILFGGDEK
jgi:hypothetical protein